jgi:hypothetical protein
MYRFKLGDRRITSSGRNLPKDFIEKIKSYLALVQEKVDKYGMGSIIGFEESSFYMDAVGNYSVEIRGNYDLRPQQFFPI